MAVAVVTVALLMCVMDTVEAQDHHLPQTYQDPKRPYSYSYQVEDAYRGLQYSAGETSDGSSVQGSYQVALPDGRVQNVRYNADHQAGFNADVTYEGQAQYAHQPTYDTHRPTYAPVHGYVTDY